METLTASVLRIIKDVCPPATPEIDDLDRPLADYGLDSLDLSAVFLAVEEKYGLSVPDEDIEELMTVNRIVGYVAGRTDESFSERTS